MRKVLTALNRRFDQALYFVFWALSRAVAALLFDVRVHARERLPARGPCLLAPNHQSFLDPWLIALSVRRQLHSLARDSLFRVPILGMILRRIHVLPVPRGSIASRRALLEAIAVLRRNEAIMLFPEGTRSSDGRFQPLKRGIGLVVRETFAPVLPILIAGAFEVWPRHRRLPRLGWGGLGRLWRRSSSAAGGIRIYFGDLLTLGPQESLDAFIERLGAAYRALALEAGAPQLCPPCREEACGLNGGTTGEMIGGVSRAGRN